MAGNTSSDILIAGALAAFTVDLLVYPLDTLKTRFQAADYKRLYTDAGTGKPNKAFFRGVYQGLGMVVVATLPSSGAFFTTYEAAKSSLTALNSTAAHPNGLLPIAFVHASASSLAELVSCAILTPAEVVKQNAQMVDTSSTATDASGKKIVKASATLSTLRALSKHPASLWTGYTSLALRNLPFTALQFPLFESLKARIKAHRDAAHKTTNSIPESACITALSAGSAGAVAAVITTPVDVLKTRVMLSAGAGKQGPGLVRVARDVVREQGWKGLWRGGALRAVWTFVGAGLYLGAYESGRVYLAARRGEGVDKEDLL